MKNPNVLVSLLLVTTILTFPSCATITGPKRILLGTSLGGAAGAGGGAAFTPNEESRGLNALVFGLGGALIGGISAALSDRGPDSAEVKSSLRERDLDLGLREFQVTPNQKLPSFLQERIQPLVIEEFTESDSVSEDGTLHEPHKAYRVKRAGELFSRPTKKAKASSR